MTLSAVITMCFWKPRVSELYSTRPIFCEDWHCTKATTNVKSKAVNPHRIVFIPARYQTARNKKKTSGPSSENAAMTPEVKRVCLVGYSFKNFSRISPLSVDTERMYMPEGKDDTSNERSACRTYGMAAPVRLLICSVRITTPSSRSNVS